MNNSKTQLSDAEMWERRRKNLKAILGFKDRVAAQVSVEAGFSKNTIGKFTRGETYSLNWNTLEAICKVLNLPSAAVLDNENPLTSPKNDIYSLVKEITDDEARIVFEAAKSALSKDK
ncbi:helix-turn-helix transcriptional regulator [Pseudovibrio sp. POLY-S9]|uniref:helix-turn-helix domain-containing protein n=1 Tax=Pseudovibrio sp. POLY-S9 TaxID=1576596 RepID=UPI000AFC8E8D|nr:helix-turn-helix transcriptional regulator [Pseudovibrio sp. POLY-S9]